MTIDLAVGLPRLREPWVLDRDDLEQLPSGFAVSSSTIRKANLDAVRKKGAKARKEKLQADHSYMDKHIRDEH